MSTTREQVLSEFIDAWNAGQRPDVDEYIARVPPDEQDALGEELLNFVTFAPTPEYSDVALAAVRTELAETLGGAAEPAGVLAALLTRLRERFGLSTAEVAGELVGDLGLEPNQAQKTAGYLERLETGKLEPTRVSRRVFEALGRVFRVPGSELEGAADRSSWSVVPMPAAAAPVFRADEDAKEAANRHLEVLA